MIKNKEHFLLLCSGGFAAGIANGLLGAGGGIIMTFVLARVIRDENDEDSKRRDVFANVILSILPISALSALIYLLRGSFSLDNFSPFLLPSVVGGSAGALLLSRINVTFLKYLFAVLVIFSGIYMILR